MTDELLAWQTQRFLALETHREGHVVPVRPEQVVEIGIVRQFLGSADDPT